MSSISFDNPLYLLIAVPLILLFTVPFIIAVRKSNRNGHNVASMIMHIVMAILVAVSVAGPSITTAVTETDVYVVADVSYSAKRNLDTIDQYIADLKLPRNSKLGLVCFGRNAEVISELDDPSKVASVKTATSIDDSATNIAHALLYTGDLFQTGVIKRIVLITDGKQTDLSDNNSIRSAITSLSAQGVKVDAIFLDDNPSVDSKEVQISGVEYTDIAYLDSEQSAVVKVQSSYETSATISLIRDEFTREDFEVNLTLGLNNVSLDLYTSESGTYAYEVYVEAVGDTNTKNNTYYFSQIVSEDMKVLVVTQSFDDALAAARRYGNNGELHIYENDTSVLTPIKTISINQYAGNPNIHFYLNTSSVPYTIEELCDYDVIILADVDVSAIDNYPVFIDSIEIAVANYGKSLATFGNLHIQNTEDPDLERLGDMLPVQFGNSDSKLYTIIMDTSRSMQQLDHMTVSKELAVRMVQTIADDCFITLVTFNSDAEVKQVVTPAYNREEIIDKIYNLEVIQGTVLGSGLNRTKAYIENLAYDYKQVLLITDGMSYSVDGADDPITVAAEMYASGIVTSVFDVGRQGDNADGTNPADPPIGPYYESCYKLLKDIAEAGHGQHFYSRNAEHLDDELFGQMTDGMTVTVVEGQDTTVSVQRLNRNDAVLEGIDALEIPNVTGYVCASTKPSATTVLSVNHKRDKDSNLTTEKPLFAYQSYGNGRVSTFTSALGGSWVKSWDGAVGNLFFGNVYENNVPTVKHTVPYAVEIIREGSVTRIEATLPTARVNASATINIVLPNQEIISESMGLVGGNTFYFEFDTSDVGGYEVTVTYTYKEQQYVYNETVYVSYLDEYDAFSVFEPSGLHRAIDEQGVVKEDGKLTIENNPDEVGRYVAEVTAPLLITVAVLFVVDVIVRKLKLEDIRSFFRIGKKKEGKR